MRAAALAGGTRRQLAEVSDIAILPYRASKGAVLEQGKGARMVFSAAASQVYFTAVQPMPLFAALGLVCGMFVIGVADALLRSAGLSGLMAPVVSIAIVRELVPLVLGLVLIGRSGTAIATEIGYMRVNREVDALQASGINTDYYLVLPRIAGVTVAAVGLTVLVSGVALVGGFVACSPLDMLSVTMRLSTLVESIDVGAMTYAVVKALAFGLIVSTVNCHHGLSVSRSFTEIPRANTRAAVQCYALGIVLNAILSLHALPRTLGG